MAAKPDMPPIPSLPEAPKVTEETRPGLPDARPAEGPNMPPVPAEPPPPAQQVPPLLAETSAAPKAPRSKKHKALDSKLSIDDWDNVLTAFTRTGVPQEIADITRLPVEAVQYLLDRGIHRLGAPPIRAVAVNHAEVARRLRNKRINPDNPPERNLQLRDPDVQEAITDRIAQEAMAASTLLQTTLKHLAVHQQWVQAVHAHVQQHGFELPDGPLPRSYLDTLAKVSDALAKVADRAVRLSKFTAGEPEHTVEVLIAQMVSMCTPEEILEAARTGKLPPRFRGRALPEATQDPLGSIVLDASFVSASDSPSSPFPDQGEPPSEPPSESPSSTDTDEDKPT